MKYCPKCGAPNKDEAKFCVKCGTPLIQKNQPSTSQPSSPNNSSNSSMSRSNSTPPKKSHKGLIIFLIIVILVLLFGIGLILGSRTPQNNKSISSSTANSAKVQKSFSTTKSSSPNDNTDNLVVNKLTPKQTVAAVAYYEGTTNAPWQSLTSNDSSHEISIKNNKDENISDKGMGASYRYDTGSPIYEYTLDGDSNGNGNGMVNLYQYDNNASGLVHPQTQVSLQTIVDKVNKDHAAQRVRDVASRIDLEDDHSPDHPNNNDNNVDTKKLTEGQLKSWALNEFKEDYPSASDDHLSIEYTGLDGDKDAEVIVHDDDNSQMDTTYRVDSNGNLQELDGDDWNTVSTVYNG